MMALPNSSLSTKLTYQPQNDPAASLEPINEVDQLGRTRLMRACYDNDLYEMSSLLKKGARLDLRDYQGFDALMITAFLGHHRALKILLFYHATYQKDNKGRTALFHAIIANKLGIVALLLHQDCNPNERDNKGRTPLHYTVRYQRYEILTHLLEKKVFVDAQNAKGNSPLIDAVKRRHTFAVALLAEHTPPSSVENSEGNTALTKAVGIGETYIVNLLLDKGANRERINSNGLTPWLVAYIGRSANREHILPLLEQSRKRKNYNIHYCLIKITAHCLDLSGCTYLPSSSRSTAAILWETGYSEFACKKFSESVLFFANETKIFDSKFAYHLHKCLLYAANSRSVALTDKLERIQKGLETFIPTGYKQHAVITLFWKNIFILFNPNMDKRALVYRFDPKLLTCEIIEIIQLLRDREAILYYEYVNNKLPKILNFQQSKIEIELERYLNFQKQTVGNCSWKCIQGIVHAYCFIHTVQFDLFSDFLTCQTYLDETAQRTGRVLANLTLYQQFYFLSKCVENKVDDNLIRASFDQIKNNIATSHLPLDNQIISLIDHLENRYFYNNP